MALLSALLWAAPAPAATIVVNSSSDTANGSDGGCTLREALANAAANAATYGDCVAGSALPTVDVIQFSGVSSITLTGAELPIAESVEIDGPVVIDGGGVGRSLRILHVTGGAVTLRDLTLQNGRDAGGGAILNANGDLDLHDCVFDGNTATSSTGGAISSSVGDLKLHGVSFTNNAASAGDGGAVWVSVTSSDVVVSGSIFTDNSASGGGGALYLSGSGTGSASIDQSTFLGNTSANSGGTKGGGAVYNALAESGGLTVSLSTFDSNVATAGQGGAIFNAAAAVATVVSNTLIEDNQANGPGISQGYGGGIYNVGQLHVIASTLLGNSAARSGGAFTNKASSSILAHLTNTTITGNTASLSGGGIWNPSGSKIETRNVTVSGNTVVSTSYGGANVWNDGVFTALNTIVADGIGTLGCGPTALTNNNGDGNLQYPAASCGAGPAAMPVGDPQLEAPVYDGGPTGLLVVPLGAGSAAIGAGNATVCSSAPVSSVDERGVARPLPVATTCDSGAYESNRIAGFASNPVPGSTVAIAAYAGSSGSGSVSISETGTDDLVVSFVGLSGDAALSLATPTSFTVPDGGAPVAIQVDCTSVSTGHFTATLTVAHTGGSSPSTYAVTCDVTPPPAPGYASSPVSGSTLAMSVQAESSTSTDVVVSETGNATLTVSSVALAGDPEISLTTATSFQIADGGASETITVACSSPNAGQYAATLTVTHDATGSPESYPVTCDVSPIPVAGYDSTPAPSSTLAMSTLAGTPTSSDVVVSETGNTALVVSNVAVSGDPEIALQTASSFQIADGGPSHTITVECSSQSVGQFTATLTVTHNGPGSPASYPVTCGVAPVPAPGYGSSPAPGSQLTLSAVTGASDSASVQVSETGTAALVVSNVAVSGDPEITLTTSSSFQIADGGLAQDVTVACSSNQVGQYTATLTVTHNATGGPATYPVVCNVSAAPAPGYDSTPAPGSQVTLAAVVAATDSASVHVSETGTAALVVSNVAVAGDPEIALVTPSSFQIADGGAAQDVTVECSATQVGQYTATLTVTHNAVGSPATYPIVCNVSAAPAPAYASSPASGSQLTLSAVTGGSDSTSVEVSEAGTAALVVSNVAVSGDPEITLVTPSSFQIADGGAAEDVTVQCASSQVGAFTATLTVTHNADGSPATYPVVCNVGAAPAPGYGSIPAPGSQLTLGAVVGASDSIRVHVSETGTAALVASSVAVFGQPEISLVTSSSFQIPDGGAAQDITVACSASEVGEYTAALIVTHNADGSPTSYPIVCTVTAVPTPAYESDPVPGSTIPLATSPFVTTAGDVMVAESADQTLVVSDVQIDGDPEIILTSPSSFQIQNGAQPKEITFQCTAPMAGSYSALLTVTHNAPDSPALYTITCNVSTPADGANSDFDGDGNADIAWQNLATGELLMWWMDGPQRLSQHAFSPDKVPGAGWRVVGAADFNRDGRADVLLQNTKTGALRQWFMKGNAKIGEANVTPSWVNDPALRVVGVGDFNGDGKPDVLRQGSGKMALNVVYLNGAVATSQASVNPDKSASSKAQAVAAPDLDGDGKADILVDLKGELSVWFMNGVTRVGTATLVPGHSTSNKHHVVAAADYDGDGKVDLLFQNKKDGRLELWLMNGIQRVTTVVPSPNKEVSVDWVVAGPK
ncbi:MAG: choice-of-anchor D domain-containing protein [bacterium]